MRFKDSLKFSLNSLITRKLRSWLTILGIIIGVAAIVAIVSVGQGMQETIQLQLGGLGSDVAYVIPGTSLSSGMMGNNFAKEPGDLKEIDLKTIKAVEGVKYVAPDIMGMQEVVYLKDSKSANIIGTDENWVNVRAPSASMAAGRFIKKSDSGVVVLGNSIANKAFDKRVFIGSQIKIGSRSYKVVGILNEFGGMSGMHEDGSVYLSLEDAKEYSLLADDLYEAIEVKVEAERTDEIAEAIKKQLMISRHVNKETIDFDVITPTMITGIVTSILTTINYFLLGIAAISLIVGAVGIANTMFTSVTERTRQIGILKSLGMTRAGIMKLFLVESALIGLVGGILGLFAGFIISGIIGHISSIFLSGSKLAGPMVSISSGLIIFTIAFSIGIGILSGILPARRAANLQPVEALRYE